MTARLVGSREIAPLVRQFNFETDQDLDFVPGQFMSFNVPIEGKMITRAYSIASPPQGNHFEICLNLVEDGRFSPWIFNLPPGEQVDCKGPYGVFTLRPTDCHTVMVATGTGITPFRSILQAHLPVDATRRHTLIFGARHEHGLYYRDEFEALAAKYANFQFIPTLTRPGPDWRGRTGRVQPHVLESVGERRDVEVYICGMKEMVEDVRAKLKESGLDRKRIVIEKYD